MKSIKDILETDSIKQRRKIANTLVISKEDKNALITNKSGGDGDGGIQIEYYKVIKYDEYSKSLISITPCFINMVTGETQNHITTQYITVNGDRLLEYWIEVLGIGIINKKTIIKKLMKDNAEVVFDGSLQERLDMLCDMSELDRVDISDYFEPITEEEFYNLKYEK